ncbi:MAG: hypothetical protein EBR81_14120, partial [Proteobacteria bacterium]|nr:hypothetical protein [Pseudomonadota bacterium]
VSAGESAGTLNGNGALIKDTSATLTLSGANTFTGALSVNAGVLNIRSNTGLGTTAGATTVNSGAALELQGGIAIGAEVLNLSGSGVSGAGALRSVNGTNAFAGPITLGAASRINTNAGQLTLSGGVNATDLDATFGGAGYTIVSGNIVLGSGSLNMDGSGVLSLGGTNSYTGATRVVSGTLILNGAASLAGTPVVVETGALLNLSAAAALAAQTALTLNGNANFATAAQTIESIQGAGILNLNSTVLTLSTGSFSGGISGSGSLVKSALGTLILSAANTFSGGLDLSGGVVQAGNNAALGTGTLTMRGGTLMSTSTSTRTLGNRLSLSNNVQFGDATNSGALTLSGSASLSAPTTLTTASNVTISGAISGNYSLTKIGGAELILSGLNTFGGSLVAGAGTLTLQTTGTVPVSTDVSVSTGALLNLAAAQEIASLSGAGSVNLQTNALNISGSTDSIFSGIISGSNGRLVKNGSSNLTLSGTNDFIGGVTLNTGAVRIGNDAALGNGAVTFTGGRLSSDSTSPRNLANAVYLSGSNLSLGDATNTGALAFGGTITLTVDTTLNVASAATFAGPVGGAYNLTKAGSGEFVLSGTNSFGGATALTTVGAGTLTLQNGAALIDTMAVSVASGAT